jgi:ATP-binding cassette subfamily C protein CydC
MRRDVMRILGLWRGHAGWLAAGVAVAMVSALAGVALLVLAARVIAAAVAPDPAGAVAVAGAGLAALVWLRTTMLVRPVARYLERLVTHEATFRALAGMRVWFFTRLAERLPAGLGLRRAGDLLGRLVADVEALDGLYPARHRAGRRLARRGADRGAGGGRGAAGPSPPSSLCRSPPP